MTDRELLELAAKAAGIKYDPEQSRPHPKSGAFWGLWLVYDYEPGDHARRYWNPLTDDGDEARMEAACDLDVEWTLECVFVGRNIYELYAKHGGDKQAARRRAGVRAAAAMALSE